MLCGVILAVWGAKSLVLALNRISYLAQSLNVLWLGASPDDKWRVDLVLFTSNVSLALVISAGVLVGLLLWWYRFLNREKWADLLIDMEGELRKVSWPTPSDAWQSTLVVTGCTVVLVAILLAYDFVINRFMLLFTGAA